MRPARSVSKSFPSKWLCAADLEHEFRLRIKHVREPEANDKGLGGKQIEKPIVGFHRAEKEMILGATNARRVADVYGDDFDNWIGREVIIRAAVHSPTGKDMVEMLPVAEDRIEE